MSLGKTRKNQTEADDEVWDLNRKIEKPLDTWVILFVRFEKVRKGPGEIDLKFDNEFAEMQDALGGGHDGSEVCREKR